MAGSGASKERMEEIGRNTRFSKDNQPENRGRKPNKVKANIHKTGYTTQDIRNLLCNTFINKTLDELKEIVLDEDADLAIKTIAKSLVRDYTKGNIDTLMILIEYGFGKPKQIIQQLTTNTNLDINTLTEEEKREILKEGLELLKEEEKNEKDRN